MNSKLEATLVAFGQFILSDERNENLENKENAKFVHDADLANFFAEQKKKQQSQTFGEKAVGFTFNPSGLDSVAHCKMNFADTIDQMDELRNSTNSQEAKRLASIAITESQGAQMWAVKALTWKD